MPKNLESAPNSEDDNQKEQKPDLMETNVFGKIPEKSQKAIEDYKKRKEEEKKEIEIQRAILEGNYRPPKEEK